jgi:hypothetical protein
MTTASPPEEVGGTYTAYRLRDRERVKQLARNDDSLERLLADRLVRLFEETKESMENLNTAPSN